MGVAIMDRVSKIDARNGLGKIVPAMSGLQYLFFGGQTANLNQVVNGKDGVVSGNLVSITDYTSDMDENDFINSQIPCGLSGTYLAVFRVYKNPNSNNTVMGCWPYSGGASLMFSSSNFFAWVTDQNGSGFGPTPAHNSAATDYKSGDFVCVAMRWATDNTNTTTVTFDNLTKGENTYKAGTTGVPIKTTTADVGPARIGTGYTYDNTSGVGHKEIGFAGIWSQAISDVELGEMYKYLKTYFSSRGINV